MTSTLCHLVVPVPVPVPVVVFGVPGGCRVCRPRSDPHTAHNCQAVPCRFAGAKTDDRGSERETTQRQE